MPLTPFCGSFKTRIDSDSARCGKIWLCGADSIQVTDGSRQVTGDRIPFLDTTRVPLN